MKGGGRGPVAEDAGNRVKPQQAERQFADENFGNRGPAAERVVKDDVGNRGRRDDVDDNIGNR